MKRRFLYAGLALLLASGLAAGHLACWYLPRYHSGQPRPGYLPAQLLASDAFSFAVWMPYPHQNLGLLGRAAAGGGATGELAPALARLAGLPQPSLPRFGAFEVPPATEIAFAADEGGERFALVAEVYPVVAAFAKLAGRLAGNAWLRGGVLDVDGRRVEVAWHGRVWTVASPGLPSLDAAPAAAGAPSLAIAEVRRAVAPLPAGRFDLTRRGGDLVLASAGAGAARRDLEELDPAALGLFLLVATGPSKTLEKPTQAMAFFLTDEREKAGTSTSYELPGMASVYETGGRRWTLPGEGLLDLAGRQVRQREIGPFSVAALDGESLQRVQELMPRLAPIARPRARDQLVWGLWLDLEGGFGEVRRIADVLAEIPIAPRRHQERWRDAAAVLAPAARSFSRLTVVVTDEPEVLRLRLVGRSR
jgi:hypothetical protein